MRKPNAKKRKAKPVDEEFDVDAYLAAYHARFQCSQVGNVLTTKLDGRPVAWMTLPNAKPMKQRKA